MKCMEGILSTAGHVIIAQMSAVAHQEISAWVTLDDLDMSHYLKNHCVTTKRVLQKEDIMKAKQLLSIQS